MKLDDKWKAYGLGILSAFIIILSGIGMFTLIDSLKPSTLPEIKEYNNMYASVIGFKEGYLIVEPIDEELGEEIQVKTDNYRDYEEGDFILINGDEITLIASKNSLADVTTTIGSTSTTSKTTTERVIPSTSSTVSTTAKNTSKKSSTTKKTTTKKTTTTTKKVVTTNKNQSADDVVIAYVEDASTYTQNGNANDETFGQKAKRYFITVVDFIFYEGEINGYKWNDLTTSAKAKVVYYSLKIDSKIDEKFPGYKETISNKYQDIKAKLVAKYLDITNTICSNSEYDEYHCKIVKQDFELLKKSVGITWDIVVDAFKYAYDKTTSYLKTWYETFSGK